ncbi:MAG: DUF4416 family protein [Planctomycetes bacterium]|nr:DUF4416 family protein [Planctomycetota bacterium]
MGKIEIPKPVKLITGILSSIPELFPEAERHLLEKFGAIDHKTALIPFDFTDYYNKTMGKPILRQFLSFSKLIEPDTLPGIKIWTNKLEDKFVNTRRQGNIPRPINLDPGYLDAAKLLLASTKDYSHRIYLSKGIYAEITLYYQNGSYQSWPWTYPDYKTKAYTEFLQTVRNAYLKQLKTLNPLV